MSDIMRPIPYGQLLRWALAEYRGEGSIFGVSKTVHAGGRALPIFDGKIETPFGPAAGPNTQLAQNIVAAYAAGSRFFELKTVQKMDGRELAACVAKPCIASGDECYNCEWSTELEVGQAYDEYVKAWFLCRILARELELGEPDGFVFNMSVGYDLEGIKSPKIDAYIDNMKDAAGTPVYEECVRESIKAAEDGLLTKADAAYIRAFPTQISSSITESTLHGCPPDEIERIATYLITEKGLNTYIKCNPTLLGYKYARETLDALGFDYIAFDDHHFREDLQWEDAVPMFERLIKLCGEKGLEFGLKLTNTFPVDVKAGELPSGEMYMSGRSLFPLTITLCDRIAKQFDGKLRISYSGGADFFNIRQIFDAGIWPITMATTILKPGGYQRLAQMAGMFEDAEYKAFDGVDPAKTEALVAYAKEDARYKKPVKPLPDRKNGLELPLLNCFTAPCQGSCPINQDIPAYLHAMEEGRAEDAFEIILARNALPFMTGTLCPHTCADRCMRNHYEEGLHIREVKLMAAEAAFENVFPRLASKKAEPLPGKKVAVIGGGPAGLAAASFLSRAGIDVTVFDKNEKAGGAPRYAIPGFRISEEALDRDVELCRAYGAEIVTGCEISSLMDLRSRGFTDFIIAVGAWSHGRKALKYGEALDALEFLTAVKAAPDSLDLGEDVVVIGGGNTAMDVARTAKRQKGVKKVSLVYRRNKRYMPADEEELQMAIDDGVAFAELLAPVGLKDGKLLCDVMKLGEPDESGRRSPEATGEQTEVKADTVITAVGERVDTSIYLTIGAGLDDKGFPIVNENLETSVKGVYAIGDCRRGPATIVKAIADAQKAAASIVAEARAIAEGEAQPSKSDIEYAHYTLFETYAAVNAKSDMKTCLDRKGVLTADTSPLPDGRCLGCPTVCEVCVDVCPNRANVAVEVTGMDRPQIIHVDRMCNECGNCAVFCPYSGRPYKDKFTLFENYLDFENSENEGFLPTDDPKVTRVRFTGKVQDVDVTDPGCGLYE
ncbi:MAG: putative selenate reductase subunit YgfK, partial [Lachnospiraceae bacterium]|nr:putative selenate reductase subunit YgfK [Lachnospiraceae bacterium]